MADENTLSIAQTNDLATDEYWEKRLLEMIKLENLLSL